MSEMAVPVALVVEHALCEGHTNKLDGCALTERYKDLKRFVTCLHWSALLRLA